MARSVNSTADEIFVIQSQSNTLSGGSGSIGNYVSIGRLATSYPGKASLGLGLNAEAVSYGSTAQGLNVRNYGLNSLAIGDNIVNSSNNSIILGANQLNGNTRDNTIMLGCSNTIAPWSYLWNGSVTYDGKGDFTSDVVGTISPNDYDFSKVKAYYYNAVDGLYYEDYQFGTIAQLEAKTYFIRIEDLTDIYGIEDNDKDAHYGGRWCYSASGEESDVVIIPQSPYTASNGGNIAVIGTKNYLKTSSQRNGILFSENSSVYTTASDNYILGSNGSNIKVNTGYYNNIINSSYSNILSTATSHSNNPNYNSIIGSHSSNIKNLQNAVIVGGDANDIISNNPINSDGHFYTYGSNNKITNPIDKDGFGFCDVVLGTRNTLTQTGKNIYTMGNDNHGYGTSSGGTEDVILLGHYNQANGQSPSQDISQIIEIGFTNKIYDGSKNSVLIGNNLYGNMESINAIGIGSDLSFGAYNTQSIYLGKNITSSQNLGGNIGIGSYINFPDNMTDCVILGSSPDTSNLGDNSAYAEIFAGGSYTDSSTKKNLRLMDKSGNMWIAGSLSTGTAVADGLLSHAEGKDTNANGNYSHAEGNTTTAKGESSHAEGYGTTAEGTASHAEGWGTTSNSNYSHSEGIFTKASGDCAHAEGINSQASGYYSHAEGCNTVANGMSAHTEGDYTTASGSSAHSEGVGNFRGGGSIAWDTSFPQAELKTKEIFGKETEIWYFENETTIDKLVLTVNTTSTTYPIYGKGTVFNPMGGAGIFDYDTDAPTSGGGAISFTEGVPYDPTKSIEVTLQTSLQAPANSYIIADYVVFNSGGSVTLSRPDKVIGAEGNGSHAEGILTAAIADAQHVSGKANIADDTKAVIVGNGTYGQGQSTVLSNAYTLDWKGNGWFAGKVTAEGTPTDDNDLVPLSYIKSLFDYNEETGALSITLPWIKSEPIITIGGDGDSEV